MRVLYLDKVHAPVSNACFPTNVWYSLQDSNGHFVRVGKSGGRRERIAKKESKSQKEGTTGNECFTQGGNYPSVVSQSDSHLCGFLRK